MTETMAQIATDDYLRTRSDEAVPTQDRPVLVVDDHDHPRYVLTVTGAGPPHIVNSGTPVSVVLHNTGLFTLLADRRECVFVVNADEIVGVVTATTLSSRLRAELESDGASAGSTLSEDFEIPGTKVPGKASEVTCVKCGLSNPYPSKDGRYVNTDQPEHALTLLWA